MKQSKISSFFSGKRPAPQNDAVDAHENGSRKKQAIKVSDDEDSPSSSPVKNSSSSSSSSKKSTSKPIEVPNKKSIVKKRTIIYSDSEEEPEACDVKVSPKKESVKDSPVKKKGKESNGKEVKEEEEDEVVEIEYKPEAKANGRKSKKDSESESESESADEAPSVKSKDKKTTAKSPKTPATKASAKSKTPEAKASKSKTPEAKSSKSKTPETKASKSKSSKATTSKSKSVTPKDKKKTTSTSTKTTKNEKSDSEEEEEKVKEKEVENEDKQEAKSDSKKDSPIKSTTNNASSPPQIKAYFTTDKVVKGNVNAPKSWNNDYNPAKDSYHPINDASWKRGELVPYLALAKTFEKIEETSKRLKIIEILSNFFRSVILLSPHDLRYSLYLCLNKIAPAYEGIELGIADNNLMKAIAQATGRPMDKIKKDVEERGDLGLVAEASRSNQRTLFNPSPLSLSAVFKKLKEIAAITGNQSQGKKVSMIQSMLVACKHAESRFLIRSLAGKLRIGLAEQSVLQALAQACYLTPPNQNQADPDAPWPPKEKMINAGKKLNADDLKAEIEKVSNIIKSCYCECPNYDILTEALLEGGVDEVSKRCRLTPGIPPRPMLAQPTKGIEQVLEKFTGVKFTAEYKYDGERAQIHLLENGDVHIYSRNQEDNTSKYPDIISRFKNCLDPEVKSCILDSEAVAWERETEMILPFQKLSTRKRKDAVEEDIKVQVCIFAFDLIYLNGESLVKEPLIKRRELLRKDFKVIPGQFGFATSIDTHCTEELQEFLEQSIKGNCEGLMVKSLEEKSSYELAKRSQKWLKLKKDYLDSGGDSLDLVVIGGYSGKGKRTGGYGGYLLACYDPDNEEYQSICKLGTGFTDEQLQQHFELLKPHVIPKPRPYYQYHSNLEPDTWFDPVVVWEVKCADLSLSPVHKAASGIVDPERGISLRFPRFLRIRDDKDATDATSAEQVSQLYKNQDQVKNAAGSKENDDDDEFY